MCGLPHISAARPSAYTGRLWGTAVIVLNVAACSSDGWLCVNSGVATQTSPCGDAALVCETPGSPLRRGANARKISSRAPTISEIGSALVWGDSKKVFASDGAELDEFGLSVSLSSQRALVGAYGENAFRGAAYIFVDENGTWGEEQKLVASDGVDSDDFGRSVSLSDGSALIGASGAGYYRGAAYVFIHDDTSWREQQKLLASDGADLDQLGWSVALTEDRALIGAYGKDSARGAAYVFAYDGNSWIEEQKLLALDGAADDRLGYAVAMHGNSALVGAPGDDEYAGAAYVFAREDSSWVQQQKLIPTDVQAFSQFGAAVAIEGDLALVGAAWVDDYLGAAYLFVRQDGIWTEAQKLVAAEGVNGERLGNAVSLSSGRALIGAAGSEENRGLVYVFEQNDGVWLERQKLLSRDGVGFDLFGTSVSLVGNKALVGANYTDQLRGAAYIFAFGSANGDACTEGTECASGFCVDGRCCNVDCNGECGACSVAEGALADGTCTLFPEGTPGSPRCENLVCDGQSPLCAACQADVMCPEGRYCTASGTCEPWKEQGQSCDARATHDCLNDACHVCRSGFCVDGVCCDASCDGQCEACVTSLKGSGLDGICEPIGAGFDPQDECRDDGALVCEHNGFCDGASACQRYGNQLNCKPEACDTGQDCASGHCEDGICCDRVCGPNERCRAELKVDGRDGLCGREIAAELGAVCEFDVQCTSGHCVDGVCTATTERDAALGGCACRVGRSQNAALSYWVAVLVGMGLNRRRKVKVRK